MGFEELLAIYEGKLVKEEHRNIWVSIELKRGEITDPSLEVLGKARQLADMLGTRVEALVFSSKREVAEKLVRYGSDNVYIVKTFPQGKFNLETYAKSLTKLAKERKPEIFLFPHTYTGSAIAALVAANLETGLVTNCVDLSIDTSERVLLQTKPIYNGKLNVVIYTPERKPQIATLKPGSAAKPFEDELRSGGISTIEVDPGEIKTKVIGEEKVKIKRDIEEAEIVFWGGTGLGSKENFDVLRRLAEKFGATVAATREAVEMGLAEEDITVGLTGKRIKPRVCLAFGVKGSYENLAAVKAKHLIAVNEDEEDPIFKIADLGVIGNPSKIAELMVKKSS